MRPTINVLDDPLLVQILEDAKRIMSEIGIDVRGTELRQRLQDYGLKVDADGERLLFPTDVVDKAIEAAPGAFTLFDRDGQSHAQIGGDQVNFVPGSSGLTVLDHRTNEARAARSSDFVEYVKLCDGLENISYLATAFSTDDIEPHVSDVWRLYMSLIHSKQPIVSGAFSEKGVPPMCEMMQLFRADRADLIRHPMSIFTITPTGKFCYSEESCQNLLDCVEAGIPVEIVPVTLMGMIAPVSLVGALVFHCVDVLAGITMAQIIRPGAPVLFGGAPAAFNMKTTAAPMSAVEALHHDVAFIAIAKHLGLPAQAYMALSDAKFLDAQAGAETFGSALLAGLAGCNSVSGPGMLDFVLTFSLVKLVFDNEMCAQVKHFLREIKPKEDLPAIDMAREVLESGHLITSNHTLEHWPQELYLNDPIIDRDDRDAWAMGGSKTLLERGVEEVEQRLAKYEPIETDASLDAEMRRIVRAGMAEDGELPPLT